MALSAALQFGVALSAVLATDELAVYRCFPNVRQ